MNDKHDTAVQVDSTFFGRSGGGMKGHEAESILAESKLGMSDYTVIS